MRGWWRLTLDTARHWSQRGPRRPQQGFGCYSNGKDECRVSLGEGRWAGKGDWEALAIVRGPSEDVWTGLVMLEAEQRAERPLEPALHSEGQGFRMGQGTF